VSKKVYLNKTDSIASAIDKVINAPDEEVVLYIPRDAEAARTKRDIELIKREVEALGKTISVESVDDNILELAAASGVRATNPFLGRSKHTVSDIVVAKPKRRTAIREEGEEVEVGPDKKVARVKVGRTRSAIPTGTRSIRKILVIVLAVASLTVITTLVLASMPRATVNLTLKKIPYGYIGALSVSPAIGESSVSDTSIKLRGVLSSKQKNMTKSYPATGTDSVGRKAKGMVTIYNAFSTESQSLVKSTRLETPEGYTYRLDEKVIIPGAKKEGGTLVPSSVNVLVTADQPGDKYNVGPVSKFTIPGFSGSAKFEGFYGESEEPMRGGSTGEVKVATDKDIENARADLEKVLEEAIKTEILMDMPDNIKIIDGAYNFTTTKEQIDDIADSKGEFSITLYGEVSLIGFDEGELLQVLGKRFSEQFGKELANFSYKAEYGETSLDSETETLNSAVNFESEWTEPFQADVFKQQIAGMTKNQLKETIFSTPGVIKGEAAIRPFWVSRVPKNLERITVDAE
jgi:hypothetical protein